MEGQAQLSSKKEEEGKDSLRVGRVPASRSPPSPLPAMGEDTWEISQTSRCLFYGAGFTCFKKEGANGSKFLDSFHQKSWQSRGIGRREAERA